MKPVLFAGPTIYGLARSIPTTIEVRAPARCGDILAALHGGAMVIGLVDGLFGDCRAVWHKEILWAISQGARVYGAASMGALRAAECADFGMIGVGGIFREYHTGARVADADVAVLHGPAETGFMPLTVALVDAQAAITMLGRSARVSLHEAASLNDAAIKLGFRHRTWAAVLAASGLAANRCDAIATAIRRDGPGRKAQDALALVAALADMRPLPNPHSPTTLPAMTRYLDQIMHQQGRDSSVTGARSRPESRLTGKISAT